MSTFFESISADEIRKVWQYGLNFAPGVAELLTKLTSHEGRLPRGAPSSGHLANLIFWDLEPLLVTRLAHRGITCTRYVDGVSLSAKWRLSDQEIRLAIAQVYKTFARKGVMPNVGKEIFYRDDGAMRVHNINVNGLVPTIPKHKRNEVRACVHQFVRDVRQQGYTDDLHHRFYHVSGRAAWVCQFHPAEGKKLLVTLKLAASNS